MNKRWAWAAGNGTSVLLNSSFEQRTVEFAITSGTAEGEYSSRVDSRSTQLLAETQRKLGLQATHMERNRLQALRDLTSAVEDMRIPKIFALMISNRHHVYDLLRLNLGSLPVVHATIPCAVIRYSRRSKFAACCSALASLHRRYRII